MELIKNFGSSIRIPCLKKCFVICNFSFLILLVRENSDFKKVGQLRIQIHAAVLLTIFIVVMKLVHTEK